MKKVTLAVLAFATLGMAAVPALAQGDDALIIRNNQKTIITGNGNDAYNSSNITNDERSNNPRGNRGRVIENNQGCDIEGNRNACENRSNINNRTRSNND